MRRSRPRRLARLAAALGLAASLSGSAGAQDRAGDFDFYVLALSWSPSFCASPEGRSNRDQCRTETPHGFVVHGLWPQRETGYPADCPTDEPQRVPQSLVEEMRDIMPGGRLVGGQWRKHGTCSGLDQTEYFALVRQAYERVTIPPDLADPGTRRHAAARWIEEAFAAANPGLSAGGIAVACEGGRLSEVRICLTRQLDFRRCPEVDRRGCRDARLVIPDDD